MQVMFWNSSTEENKNNRAALNSAHIQTQHYQHHCTSCLPTPSKVVFSIWSTFSSSSLRVVHWTLESVVMASQMISVPSIVQRIVKSVSCLIKLQVKFAGVPDTTDMSGMVWSAR